MLKFSPLSDAAGQLLGGYLMFDMTEIAPGQNFETRLCLYFKYYLYHGT